LRTRQAQTNFRLQLRNDNLLAWRFEIYNIENWVFDEGKELLRQEKGCGKGGGLTSWEWHPATDTDPALAYFDLSFFIAEGCVERAIVSAGGPKIKCVHSGIKFGRDIQPPDPPQSELNDGKAHDQQQPDLEDKAADLFERARTSATASYLSHSGTLTYTYPATFTPTPYVPMDWTGTNDTVTLTFTSIFTSVVSISARVTTYTTTIEVVESDTLPTPLPTPSASSNTQRSSSAKSSTTSSTSANPSCMVGVTFNTTYAAQSGESIWVAGSSPELGEWNVAKALKLNATSIPNQPTTWNGTVKLHNGENVSYKFVRVQKNGAAIWEADPNRNVLTPGCNQPLLVTGGPWQSTSIPCTSRNATFEVSVTTKAGESIYVVGSSAELGQWTANRAVALSASSYTASNPVWRGNVSLAVGQDVQYKYIKGGRDGSVVWESDPNRKLSVPSNCDGSLVQRDKWQA
jgi:hypothetical protein